MSDHNGSWRSFNDQFRETPGERNERLREGLAQRRIAHLLKLVADLSGHLTDEGDSYSTEGLHAMRCRVANSLPIDICPDWLHEYRDAPMVQS